MLPSRNTRSTVRASSASKAPPAKRVPKAAQRNSTKLPTKKPKATSSRVTKSKKPAPKKKALHVARPSTVSFHHKLSLKSKKTIQILQLVRTLLLLQFTRLHNNINKQSATSPESHQKSTSSFSRTWIPYLRLPVAKNSTISTQA